MKIASRGLSATSQCWPLVGGLSRSLFPATRLFSIPFFVTRRIHRNLFLPRSHTGSHPITTLACSFPPGTARSSVRGVGENANRTSVPRSASFLSIFDVHINRSPLAAMVRQDPDTAPGKFLAAYKAGRRNQERAERARAGRRRFRRDRSPDCRSRRLEGSSVEFHEKRQVWPAGERFGLIQFGSRMEIVLPSWDGKVRVRVGDRVKGGRDHHRGACMKLMTLRRRKNGPDCERRGIYLSA